MPDQQPSTDPPVNESKFKVFNRVFYSYTKLKKMRDKIFQHSNDNKRAKNEDDRSDLPTARRKETRNDMPTAKEKKPRTEMPTAKEKKPQTDDVTVEALSPGVAPTQFVLVDAEVRPAHPKFRKHKEQTVSIDQSKPPVELKSSNERPSTSSESTRISNAALAVLNDPNIPEPRTPPYAKRSTVEYKIEYKMHQGQLIRRYIPINP
ncbi:hypothetical protein M3Y95_00920000 [Aphelenchoides besseyi]|nr:hypothetical protein M3Y95_00920000 [Aphelenchoides besseyi]